MDLFLNDRVAIVGGASQGIGHGIARLLAAEGAKVVITARRAGDLAAAAERIRDETGAEVLPIQADSRRTEDCARVIAATEERFGSVDILVNNDGAPPIGRIESFDDEAWARAIEQNFMYVVRMTRGVLPLMKARGGSILNITAISAIQPIPGFGLSVATWGGVIAYAKTLSLEVAPHKITVNTICPGYIETGRLKKVFAAGGEDPELMRHDLVSQVPLGRIGTVEDIASVVALLVSPRGSYITGAAIQVDGGLLRAVR